MFDLRSANHEFDFETDGFATDAPDLCSIIQQCSGLPTAAKTAAITRKFDRILDAGELDRLTNPQSLKARGPDELEQLQTRRKALGSYLGSFLTCVLIRLPGICYTIEIDTAAHSVVHWECQIS